MRVWHCGLGFSLSLAVGLGFGCAAGSAKPPGTGGAGGGAGTSGGGEGGGFTTGPGSGGSGGAASCATFSAAAKQASAAMLFVLDGSASMNQQNKWGTAQLAVVQAIDNNVFDTMSLGLVTFPSSFVDPPKCLCDFYFPGQSTAQCKASFATLTGASGVSCGTSALPQVPIAPAGMSKSNAPSGVRHEMYQYLVKTSPLSNGDDGSPIYDALQKGYESLKGPAVSADKRIVVLITDGGFSCTSVANPPRPGDTDGACLDWEFPGTVNDLINGARLDATKPINTFVVGVPGSDSNGEMQGAYSTPMYSMRLALSTYAVNGSPDTVDPACDKNLVFTKNGSAPAKPCHIDLSSGANFNPDALANAIAAIRGKALGCLYTLPDPPPGKTIDLGLVNVVVTVGGVKATIPKRSTPADDCAKDGCWDYTGTQQVQLLGKTCADVSAATDAAVDINVGCATIVK
jgi:hypothetical protein